MIYEGKEYKEVTDGSAKIGDLLYIYSIDGNRRRDWCLTLNSDPYYPFAEIELPSYINFLDISRDEWTRYRYVKDVEETPVKFKSGDRVQVVGCRGVRQERFTGYFGKVMYINDLGKYSVLLDVGPQLPFPQESLKLVEETPVPKEQIIPLKKSKKAHDLINQTSKNIKKNDTVNSPSHYNQTKIEAIDIIEDVTAGYQSNVKYHIGNAIKYLIRAPFKNNTVEDLKKAVWYIQRAIEKLEGEK